MLITFFIAQTVPKSARYVFLLLTVHYIQGYKVLRWYWNNLSFSTPLLLISTTVQWSSSEGVSVRAFLWQPLPIRVKAKQDFLSVKISRRWAGKTRFSQGLFRVFIFCLLCYSMHPKMNYLVLLMNLCLKNLNIILPSRHFSQHWFRRFFFQTTPPEG